MSEFFTVVTGGGYRDDLLENLHRALNKIFFSAKLLRGGYLEVRLMALRGITKEKWERTMIDSDRNEVLKRLIEDGDSVS